MTIEEIIKEAFSQGWNASHECATDFDYEYALKNCLSELGSEVKKLNLPDVVLRSELLPKRLSNEAYQMANMANYDEFVEWWDSQV